MTSPTPDLAELLELPWRVWPPEERATRPADTSTCSSCWASYDVLVVSGSEVRVNLTFAAASSIVAAVNALPALLDAAEERDELAAAVERVRALHYAADNDAARTPICETCHGKSGAHECGCWADRDREPVCGHCNEGHKGMSVPWPCPTIRALDGEARP